MGELARGSHAVPMAPPPPVGGAGGDLGRMPAP